MVLFLCSFESIQMTNGSIQIIIDNSSLTGNINHNKSIYSNSDTNITATITINNNNISDSSVIRSSNCNSSSSSKNDTNYISEDDLMSSNVTMHCRTANINGDKITSSNECRDRCMNNSNDTVSRKYDSNGISNRMNDCDSKNIIEDERRSNCYTVISKYDSNSNNNTSSSSNNDSSIGSDTSDDDDGSNSNNSSGSFENDNDTSTCDSSINLGLGDDSSYAHQCKNYNNKNSDDNKKKKYSHDKNNDINIDKSSNEIRTNSINRYNKVKYPCNIKRINLRHRENETNYAEKIIDIFSNLPVIYEGYSDRNILLSLLASKYNLTSSPAGDVEVNLCM